MEEALAALGFQPSEVRVYIALLELGGATVTEAAKRAKTTRTNTYDVLSRLVQIGLATRAAGEKKQTYQAEPPAKLPLILEQKAVEAADHAKEARKMVSELNMLAKSKMKKPQVRLFEGTCGIKELYADSLLSKEVIRAFNSADSLEAFDPEFMHEYYQRRTKKKIFAKGILGDSPTGREYQKQGPDLRREVRLVPPEMMDIKPEVYVYENKTAFFSLDERFAVLIESEDIAYALKKLYDLAWEKAKEYDERKPTAPPTTTYPRFRNLGYGVSLG